MLRLLFSPIRWLLRLIFLFLLLGVLLIFAALTWSDRLLERQIRKSTDFPASIGKLDISLLGTRVDLLDLEVRNPVDFGDSRFLRVDRFSANLRAGSIWESRRDYRSVVLRIDRLTLVQDSSGLNFFEFWDRLSGSPSPYLPVSVGSGEDREGLPEVGPIRIEHLELRLNHLDIVRIEDGRPVVRQNPVHLELELEEITDLGQVLRALESEIGELPAEMVVLLLAEGLWGVERFVWIARDARTEIGQTGSYLWERGVDAVGTLKNFVEERNR